MLSPSSGLQALLWFSSLSWLVPVFSWLWQSQNGRRTGQADMLHGTHMSGGRWWEEKASIGRTVSGIPTLLSWQRHVSMAPHCGSVQSSHHRMSNCASSLCGCKRSVFSRMNELNSTTTEWSLSPSSHAIVRWLLNPTNHLSLSICPSVHASPSVNRPLYVNGLGSFNILTITM